MVIKSHEWCGEQQSRNPTEVQASGFEIIANQCIPKLTNIDRILYGYFLFVTFQLDVFANQTSGGAVNITVIYNELYGALFELVDDTIWNTASLDREYQDAYNLLVIAYGDAGVITANVSQFSICNYSAEWIRNKGFLWYLDTY